MRGMGKRMKRFFKPPFTSHTYTNTLPTSLSFLTHIYISGVMGKLIHGDARSGKHAYELGGD